MNLKNKNSINQKGDIVKIHFHLLIFESTFFIDDIFYDINNEVFAKVKSTIDNKSFGSFYLSKTYKTTRAIIFEKFFDEKHKTILYNKNKKVL